MSVKNNVATLVLYIQKGYKIVIKTIHYTMNILSIKLFAIRYDISWATQIQNVKHIVIITDVTPAAKQIFDSSVHSHQLYTIAISSDLRSFFIKKNNNSISFWDCPSSNKCFFYLLVDKELKHHKIDSILSSRISWELSKRKECNSIVKK